MSFVCYPAIDVRDGRVVRLRQGNYACETRYPDAPLALARRHAADGARWLHLVDLDAARAGGYTLQPLLARIREATGLRIQTGGGVRGEGDVRALLEAGADRVVVGSLAVEQPALVRGWLASFGADRITVALDARQGGDGQWRLPSRGWTTEVGASLASILEAFDGSGLRHVLCTDIARDGMLAGPNLALYAEVLRRSPALCLQASGGVRGLDDVAAVRAAGCSGVVLGKALLEGRLALRDALSIEEATC